MKVNAFIAPCWSATIKFSGTKITKAIRLGTETCKNAQDIIANIKYEMWEMNKYRRSTASSKNLKKGFFFSSYEVLQLFLDEVRKIKMLPVPPRASDNHFIFSSIAARVLLTTSTKA